MKERRIEVSKIKEVLTLKEIKGRFIIENGQAKDKKTKRIYFCPRDIGFDFTFDDCKVSVCSQCWAEVKEYLNFRVKE